MAEGPAATALTRAAAAVVYWSGQQYRRRKMGFDNDFYGSMQDLKGLSVVHAEFASVSADGAERDAYRPIVPILQRIRSVVGLDVLFVCQFLDGAPVVRLPDPAAAASPACDPAEVGYADMLLDACRPPAQGVRGGPRRLHAAVVSKQGRRFGTVSCNVRPHRPGMPSDDATALESVARIVALALSRGETPDTSAVWESSAAAPLGLH